MVYVSAGVFWGMRLAICCASMGEIWSARDVLDDALRLQLGERGDLTDAGLAVLLLHVLDHLVAAVHAEVDVEVRHAHALRIQEALEEQVVRDGIEVGDPQRVRDERAGAGAAARSDGDAVLLSELDEVPDDEEVSWEFHPADDVHLHREALAIRVLVDLLADLGELAEATLEALLRDLAEVRRLVHADGDAEAREHRVAELQLELTLLADGEGVADRIGDVGEELRHLVAGLQVHLARAVAALLRLLVGAAALDAAEVHVRLGVVLAAVVDVVGGDEREIEALGEIDEDALEDGLLRQPVILELDVERPRLEHFLQAPESLRAGLDALLEHRLRDHAAHASRHPDEALGAALEVLQRDARDACGTGRIGLDVAA